MLTEVWQVIGIYAAWVALSGIVLWVLARWSASRKLHVSVSIVAALVTLICIAFPAYAFTAMPGTPRTPLRLLIANRAPPLLYSFIAWPYVACLAVAQIAGRLSTTPRATRWLSFVSSLVISCISPPALLIAGCALAGVCF